MKVALSSAEYDEIYEILRKMEVGKQYYKNARRRLARKYNVKRKSIKIDLTGPFMEAEPK